MTDAEYTVVKAQVEAAIAKWHDLVIMEWDFYPAYERGTGTPDAAGWPPNMAIACKWEYLTAELTVYAETLHDSQLNLDQLVLHEMAHCLVNEMEDYEKTDRGVRHEEHVVTKLARAFRHVWDAAYAQGETHGREAATDPAEGAPGPGEGDAGRGEGAHRTEES